MMTLDKLNELIAELKAAQLAYRNAKQAVYDAECQLSEQVCPYKIGDVITIERGYTHTGKQMQITEFVPYDNASWKFSDFPLDKKWRCKGVVLKVDGTPSKFDAYEWGVTL